jgi:transposase-like protein
MAEEAMRCLHCHSETVVKYGTTSNGKGRYRCQQASTCGRMFMRDSAYPGRLPAVKRQSVDLTLNGRGARECARAAYQSQDGD